MLTLLTSILVAFVLAAGTGVVLYKAQKPVYLVDAMPTVRISDPGDNLVGPDWSGLFKVPQASTPVSRADDDRE